MSKTATNATDWPVIESELTQLRQDALRSAAGDGAALRQQSKDLNLLFSELGITPTEKAEVRTLSVAERKLEKLQLDNANEALSGSAKITRQVVRIDQAIEQLLQRGPGNPAPSLGALTLVKELRDKQEALRECREEIAQKDPEAFLAIHARELRAYKRQLENGRIVRVPFVESQLRKTIEGLESSPVVIIHGETGTGKTELAKIAAQEHTGREAIIVRGYSGMGSGELFGHHELKASAQLQAHKISEKIEEQLRIFQQSRDEKEISDEDKRIISQAVLNENRVTVSNFLLGAAYRAVAEGRVLIIDEANYVPPPLLAKLNDIMTKKPGEVIHVQEDGIAPIEVQEGFGIIMTGNVNVGSTKRYENRHEFEAALLDRAAKVEHNHLPQAVQGNLSDFTARDKQLYTVMVADLLSGSRAVRTTGVTQMLEDRIGCMLTPGGEAALSKLWKLAQFAAVTQQAFAGKIGSGDASSFQSGAVSVGLRPDLHLSNRGVIRLIEDWKSSGFEYELDHYLHKHLLERCIKAVDRAYFYQLGQKFGFFQGQGWAQDPDYGTTGKLENFEIGDPRLKAEAAEIVPGMAVIESIYGPAPKRTVWPEETEPEGSARQEEANSWFQAQRDATQTMNEVSELLELYKSLAPSKPVAS